MIAVAARDLRELVPCGSGLWRSQFRANAVVPGELRPTQYVYRERTVEHGGVRRQALVLVGVLEASYDYRPIFSDLPPPAVTWIWDVRDDEIADQAVLADRADGREHGLGIP